MTSGFACHAGGRALWPMTAFTAESSSMQESPPFRRRAAVHGTLMAAAIAGMLAASMGAQAQVRPDAGTILDQNRQPGQPVPQPPRQVLPPAGATPAAPAGDETPLTIRQIVIEGATRFPPEQLTALLGDLVGKPVTLSQLRAGAERISELYQSQGYFLSRAVIPQQDARDGTLRIRVVEAVYGKVGVSNTGTVRLKSAVATNTLAAQGVSAGAPLRREQLERGLMLLGDLPGVQADVSLAPGAAVGQSDASINVTEGPLLSGLVGLDNLGNRYTGSNRLTGSVYLNDAFGYGDLANLRVNKTSGSQYAYASYLAPVGSNGLKVGVNASTLDYHLCCAFEALQAKGHASTAAGTLSYPLIMNQAQILTGGLSAERRRSTDVTIAGQTADRKVDAFTASLAWLVSDRYGGLNSVYGALVHGRLDLSANPGNASFDSATALTQGSYNKLRTAYTRLQTFGTRHQVLLRLNGQWADRNLDSSEKIIIGGYDGVRAYPQGEAPGDMALTGTVEYSYALPVSVPGTLRLATFIDSGRVQLNKSTWDGFQGGRSNLPNTYSLTGIGVGLNWTLPRNFSLNLNIAGKLGGNPGASASGDDADGRSSKVRGWLVLTKYL